MADDNKRLNLRGLDYFYHKLVTDASVVKYNTKEYWNAHPELIPPQGTIVVYSNQRTDPNTGDPIPDMKVCDGLAYLIDQPFVGADIRGALSAHISDTDSHIQSGERAFWDDKINVDDAYEQVHGNLLNENLILTREIVSHS